MSDNSQECDKNTYFLETFSNKAFTQKAQKTAKGILSVQDFKKHLRSDIKIIGITGTNGKTTTAAIIYSLLLDLGYKVAMQGTRGFFVNDKQLEPKSLTTPQVLTNHIHINTACEQNCEFFITEVSSHAIAQNRIEGIDFYLKILTNITSDHLDFHKTLQEYIAVKNSFFTPQDLVLFNNDEKNFRAKGNKYRSYAIEAQATYKLQAYTSNGFLSGIIGLGLEKPQAFSSSLIGFFNLYNILAAVAAVHILTQKPLKQICKKLPNFAGVMGRMEVVSQDPLIFVDFAHTQDGVLQALSSLHPAKILTVIGAGGNRDKTKRPLMGAVSERYSKQVFITSDNPRDEDPEQIMQDILQGFKDKSKARLIADRKTAIKTAINSLQKGEVLAILGKGDENYQEIKGEFFSLSDKQIVQDYLKDTNDNRNATS